MTGAESFLDEDSMEDYDDNVFPEGEIVEWFDEYANSNKFPLFLSLPDPLPEYVVDRSIACQTGQEVPWTGVWYPSTGLEDHSLTFAIKGLRMQPAYRVIKNSKQIATEGGLYATPETRAVATTWHPLVLSNCHVQADQELRGKAVSPFLRAGI